MFIHVLIYSIYAHVSYINVTEFLCIIVYMFMCTEMCVHVCGHIHACHHVFLRIYVSLYEYMYVYWDECACEHVFMCVLIYVDLYMHMCLCMCIHVYICLLSNGAFKSLSVTPCDHLPCHVLMCDTV